jgi:hypothetical protein
MKMLRSGTGVGFVLDLPPHLDELRGMPVATAG